MIKNLKRGLRYEFLWIDTYNFIGWQYEDDIDGKTVDKEFQSTVGYYIKEIKGWYVAAMHHNPNYQLGFPQWGNIVYIPKHAVQKVKQL